MKRTIVTLLMILLPAAMIAGLACCAFFIEPLRAETRWALLAAAAIVAIVGMVSVLIRLCGVKKAAVILVKIGLSVGILAYVLIRPSRPPAARTTSTNSSPRRKPGACWRRALRSPPRASS